MRDALSPGLAEVVDTAQRKVQESQPQLDPTEGVAAVKGFVAALGEAVMPVQPAGAASLPGSLYTLSSCYHHYYCYFHYHVLFLYFIFVHSTNFSVLFNLYFMTLIFMLVLLVYY